MKDSNFNLSKSIILIFCLFVIPSFASAQFDNFSGRWKASEHKNRMQRLMEDDDAEKYTETIVNSVSDNGKNLLIDFIRENQIGQQFDHTYTLISGINGNINGSGEQNSVKFTGTVTGNNSEQKIVLSGHYIESSGEEFGMELVYRDTDTGKILQMNLRLTDTDQNSYDESEIETRAGVNNDLSYWRVINFIPDND